MKPIQTFEYGQIVKVKPDSPKEMNPGRLGSVCGVDLRNGEYQYLVEFGSGHAVEVPGDFLEEAESSG